MFCRTAGQSSFVWSRCRPRYRKVITLSTRLSPSSPSRLTSIYQHIVAISTSLRQSLFSVDLWHLYDCRCLKSLAACMCIPHWSHHGNASGPYWNIATLYLQWLNIKCSLSIPGVFALAGHPSTGQSTDFTIRGNDTLYTSSLPPMTSTPLICVNTLPYTLYISCRMEEASIVLPHTS